MTTTLHPASTADTRTMTTRRPQFDFGERLGQRHFVHGDLLTSHLVAVLSAIIPEGERFVVDAVKRYRSDLTDPQLRQQANTFVGQESMHQREHDRLNAVLQRMGYPMRAIEAMGSVMRGIGRRLPRQTQLAVTAAIEHWTAVLAEHVLGEEREGPGPLDEEVRAFITWHLIEEIEHKSVAFDIMQALGTTEQERIDAMRILLVMVGPVLGLGLLLSLATDPAAWNPANVRQSLQWMRSNSAMSDTTFRDDIAAWQRAGFHPDERDHSALLERWRAEAFGEGSIVHQRSRRPVA